jgi:peptidoglycan-associated lipoprotein
MKFMALCQVCIMAAGLVIIAGCSKQITKISEPVLSTEPPKVINQNPPPVDSSVFAPFNMDSAAKAVLVPVYFDFDKAEIKAAETVKLDKIGPFLMKHGDLRVLAEGNCDERGSNEYNIGLGDKRARAIRAWLVAYGVAEERIEITSYGKERPVRTNCQDEACHELNRRVEWKVLEK